MRGFRDIHSHFLYGLDDGAQSRQDMERMLDAAYQDGIVHLYATPHALPGVRPFDWGAYRERLEEARSYCRDKDYPLELHPGAEVLYTPAIEPYALDGRLPTLDGGDALLVEFVPNIAYRELENAVALLCRAGYRPILAHIERCECLYAANAAQRLKERYGVRCQLNANSLLESRGFFRDRRIHKWLQNRLIDFIASDAHDCRHRPFRMTAAHRALASLPLPYANAITGPDNPL